MRRSTWTAGWAVLAICATFVEAIVRLATRAWTELAHGLTAEQWWLLVGLVIAMTYVEGYRALQHRFAPAVVARAWEAGQRDTGWPILAPLYAIALVGAPPRATIRSLCGIAMIVACVIAVRALPAPWRGIVDAAVASALAWGLLALVGQFVGSLVAPRAVHAASALTREVA